jgi:dual specificity MAP kinase phosphatase
MYAKELSLNDAFTFVRARKPDISPNFHFMEQLHSFERQLKSERIAHIPSTSTTPSTTTFSENTPSSAASSSSSSMRQHHHRFNKYSCTCNESECKCMQTHDFLLGPITNMSSIGVSPDSGEHNTKASVFDYFSVF